MVNLLFALPGGKIEDCGVIVACFFLCCYTFEKTLQDQSLEQAVYLTVVSIKQIGQFACRYSIRPLHGDVHHYLVMQREIRYVISNSLIWHKRGVEGAGQEHRDDH